MMYSNAASAISNWRSNGCDLEQIAREGYLDIFVNQTWAGAWNEVGVRHNAFWNEPMLGWTYQLAYTLVHGAMLAKTEVRHYPLIEIFDAWESWDVLHTVPRRLRWGIWAYSHAAVKTPTGIVMPQGSYISWANQGKRLLSNEDVNSLRTTIGAAVTDAERFTAHACLLARGDAVADRPRDRHLQLHDQGVDRRAVWLPCEVAHAYPLDYTHGMAATGRYGSRDRWGGSGTSYVLAADSVNRMLASAGRLYAAEVRAGQTTAAEVWRTNDGEIHMLFGNLEEGSRDDVDRSRHVTRVLPAAWRADT